MNTFSSINNIISIIILFSLINENITNSTVELNVTKAYLNGTFLINSLYDESIYLGLNYENSIKSDIKTEYDIYKVYQNGYILLSRDLNKILGINTNQKNNFFSMIKI